MIIGTCTIELHIPAALSLKDKRQVIRSVSHRIRNKFNVAIAEVDHLESPQSSVLAVVGVSNDQTYLHGLLNKVAKWIEETRLDCELVEYYTDFIY